MQPDYSDTAVSRRSKHDEAQRNLWTALFDAHAEPDPDRDERAKPDIEVRRPLGGRRFFDIKVARDDGSVFIEQNAWRDYPLADTWIAVAEHFSAEVYAIVGADDLWTHVGHSDEVAPSGDLGYRFRLAGTGLEYEGRERAKHLAQRAFFRDPGELRELLYCAGCHTFKADGEFDRNWTKPDRRFRQVYCKECDRPQSRGGVRPG